eukprot:4384249-Prymnesium_polylepis.1
MSGRRRFGMGRERTVAGLRGQTVAGAGASARQRIAIRSRAAWAAGRCLVCGSAHRGACEATVAMSGRR